MRILLVEDDSLIGSGVEAGLKQENFVVDWVRDGADASLALSTMKYSLIVLDLGLPKMSGEAILRSLRSTGDDTPVLLLTARGCAEDRIRGLNQGADDYVAKPFDLGELIARVRALIRRSQGRSADLIVYRNISVDLLSRRVEKDGDSVKLTLREFSLLVGLMTHTGATQSKTRLQDLLYGWDEEIESNAIEAHISNLRRKLGSELIKTVRGVGYIIE